MSTAPALPFPQFFLSVCMSLLLSSLPSSLLNFRVILRTRGVPKRPTRDDEGHRASVSMDPDGSLLSPEINVV